MIREPLTMFCYTDIAAQVRGKGFPTRLLGKRLKSGIAWTPTNIMLTSLGPIADTPWGPFGDLTMMPDPATEVHVDFDDESPAEHFFLSDIQSTDGAPWNCCPRHFLRTVLAALKEEANLVPIAPFEHESMYSGANARLGDGYALDAIRRHGCFGEVFIAALRQAGLEPDSYLPEYGSAQFEVTLPPTAPITACDQAVAVRELARASAWRLGETVSFAPRCEPDGLGNGVHIHFSLGDVNGVPISYDERQPWGVSSTAAHFLAGIQKHMAALCAFTAPTPTSYMRLVPHTWSAAWSNIGERDREAGLRICPVFSTSERRTEEQFNFEYRAADASANPYLQLGVILAAGLEGVRAKLAMPEPTRIDPGTLSESERQHRGIARLPTSLEAALAALGADATAKAWLPAPLLEAYRRYKGSEVEITKDWDDAELCRRYREVY